MTNWEVLKLDGSKDGETAFNYVGTYESEQAWYLGYPPLVSERIGKKYGPGEYLFLDDENGSFKRFSVGVREEFYEVEVEEAPMDDATAKYDAAYDSAAATMEREG